jgi:hypothetical protein
MTNGQNGEVAQSPPQEKEANAEDCLPLATGGLSPTELLAALGNAGDQFRTFFKDRPRLPLADVMELGKYYAVHKLTSPETTPQELKVVNQLLAIVSAYEQAQARAADRQQGLKLREAAHELRVKKAAEKEARARAEAQRKAPKNFDNSARIAELRREYFKDLQPPESIGCQIAAFAKAGQEWIPLPGAPDYVPPSGHPLNPP